MNIYRQGNGPRPWKVRDRHKCDKVFSFPSKRLAEAFIAEQWQARARTEAGLPDRKPDVSYAELCELYLDAYTAKSKPWLKQMLGYSRERWGTVRVRNLTPELIAPWLHQLTLSPKTQKHILTAMRQVLNQGVEWGYLDKSPVRPAAVRAPKATGSDDVRPFESWGEVIRLSEALGRHGPMARFACSTGLRPSELLALQWSDIDTEGRVLHIRRTYTPRHGLADAGKTPGSLRAVVLSRNTLDAISVLPAPLKQEQLVFPGRSGGYLHADKFREGAWKKALEAAGLEYRPPYQMRHTYATLALAAGASLDWISAQMGHTTIQTTRSFYARFLKAYDERQLACLDQIGDTDAQTRNPRTHHPTHQ